MGHKRGANLFFVCNFVNNKLILIRFFTIRSNNECMTWCVCCDRCWLMLERCRKSLQYHQVVCYDNLPLTNLSGHPLESLSKHRLYARLPKQTEHYLVGDKDILYWRVAPTT